MTIDEQIEQAQERKLHLDYVFSRVEVIDQDTADLVEVLVDMSVHEARRIEVLSFMLPENRFQSTPSKN